MFRMWYEETLCLLDRSGIDICIFLYIECWLFYNINFPVAPPHCLSLVILPSF